jgi:hypothetical protein
MLDYIFIKQKKTHNFYCEFLTNIFLESKFLKFYDEAL